MACRFCGRNVLWRRRGICQSCYRNPIIRADFTPDPKRAPVGRDFYRASRLPPFPTRYLPGSPGKIEVMAKRALQRVSLFHPWDATR